MYAASDFSFFQARIVSLEDLQAEIPDLPYLALPETDRRSEPLLRPLAESLGPRLVLPEVWQAIFPSCGVLISSALSGGSLEQRFLEAPKGRSWLLPEPMSMEFPLPCPSGCGVPTAIPADLPSFYSEALCCQYAHFLRNHQGFLVLWDTEETMDKKQELAKACGFCGYASP